MAVRARRRFTLCPALPLVAVFALSTAGCSEKEPSSGESGSQAGASASSAKEKSKPAAQSSAPAILAADDSIKSPSNPLGLPPVRVKLSPDKRVFAVSGEMLARAKPGSTFVLYTAKVVGFEGDDLLIEGKSGPNYKVHPSYVIAAPDDPKIKVGEPIITEYTGVMKHAIVNKILQGGRIVVRYTDVDARAPEAYLKPKETTIIPQINGLQGGNYAAWKEGDIYRHVLLISSVVVNNTKQWLVLGYAGAAHIVPETALTAIPIKLKAKEGETVWAESVGVLRRATVQNADTAGFFTVKYERAGRPATLGLGFIMPPLEGSENNASGAGSQNNKNGGEPK